MTIRFSFSLNDAEWRCVREAAKDAHMKTGDYARLMVLCAAGIGGVLEHLERASRASIVVDKRGVLVEVKP